MEKCFNIIGKSNHIGLSKAIAKKHDLGIIIDYRLDEVIITGPEEAIKNYELDLVGAIMAHVME